jgi:ABC-type branched-subunit amino acid transport system ATPase component
MLSIGLTLLMGPKVLMLDEPSSDLAPLMVDLVFQSIRDIRARLDMPVLLVEQNVDKALSLADRVTVLVRGRDALDVPVDDVDHAQLHDLFLNGSVRTDAAGAGQR